MLWHIGNTTVRTPYRLHEALKALETSPLNGNLAGREQEQLFAEFLHASEIVNVSRIEQGLDASDVGRKWRVALSQLGFITPRLTNATESGAVDPVIACHAEPINQLSGRQYEITPNGHRLASATLLTAQQECFLRALVSYRIPSPIEQGYEGESFSPLRFVLNVVHSIKEKGGADRLTFEEFALFVQTASPADGIEATADRVLAFREQREAAKGSVRKFDGAQYEAIADEVKRKPATLDDYADLSFRYLKATGLFRNAGRGISLVPNRAQLAELIRVQDIGFENDAEYFQALWEGASLPTDDLATARIVVEDLANQLNARGEAVTAPPPEALLPDIEIVRHEFEARLLELDETEYANAQADQLDEIATWMQALIENKKTAPTSTGEKLSVPKGEGPAYLEWIVWRAFLAINSLVNPAWEARRFQIDQDFLPVHCAPGGGPDMVFEFENAIVVVEVTLTASSRQEAAEGEPVRRHVASYAEKSDKQVFGLFIALQIDSNTAHTFSSGDWYLKDDSKINLSIVPMTLADFRALVLSGQDALHEMPDKLRTFLVECRAQANQDAPAWKKSIAKIAEQFSK